VTPEQLQAIRDRATRPRRTVPIVLDGDLQQRIEALQASLDQPIAKAVDRRLSTRTRPRAVDEATRGRLDELHAQAAAATLHVVIEGMPGTEWRELLAAHPPRRDEAGKVIEDDDLGANEETIRTPMVRRCVVGHRPDPDGEEIAELDADWLLGFVTDLQMDKLVSAALAVCRGDDAVPLPRPPSTTSGSDDE